MAMCSGRSSLGILQLVKDEDSSTVQSGLNSVEREKVLPGGSAMRKILIAVVGLGALFGLWQLRLHRFGPTAGTRGHDSADQFESKFKEIQLDMSEKYVDQILAGYRCDRRELAEDEKEEPRNPYGYWKLNRKA